MARISLSEFSRRYLEALKERTICPQQRNTGLDDCADKFAVNVTLGLSKSRKSDWRRQENQFEADDEQL